MSTVSIGVADVPVVSDLLNVLRGGVRFIESFYADFVSPELRPYLLFVLGIFALSILIDLAVEMLAMIYWGLEFLARKTARAYDEVGSPDELASMAFPSFAVAADRLFARIGVRSFVYRSLVVDKIHEKPGEDRLRSGSGMLHKPEPLLEFIDTDLTYLRVGGLFRALLRRTLATLAVVGTVLFSFPLFLVWELVRANKVRILLAALLTLWYYEFVPPIYSWVSEKVGQLQLTFPQASTLVAIGALLAVVLYVAFNSDVRARAEANKNASVECRAALLKLSRDLVELAKELARLRRFALDNLRIFPVYDEIEKFTGRSDLVWRGSKIVPFDASRVPGRMAGVIHSSMWISKTVDMLEIRFTAALPESYPTNREAQRVLCSAEERVARIVAELETLRGSGSILKLDRVVSPLGSDYVGQMLDSEFSLVKLRELLDRSGTPWWSGGFVDDPYRMDILSTKFTDLHLMEAPPLNGSLYSATADLTAEVRKSQRLMFDALWETGLTAVRLSWLSSFVSSSLRPGVLERTRQAFGK